MKESSETGAPISPEQKKKYVLQTCEDGETWSTFMESENIDELVAKKKEMEHVGADTISDFRIQEK